MKFVFSLVNVSNDRYSSLFKSMSCDMDDALSVSVTIRSLFIVSWRMESSLPPLINITSCKIRGSSFSTILKVFSKKNCGNNSYIYLRMLSEYIYQYKIYIYLSIFAWAWERNFSLSFCSSQSDFNECCSNGFLKNFMLYVITPRLHQSTACP